MTRSVKWEQRYSVGKRGIVVRDRVKELRRVKASELVPNEKNWRRHDKPQADALKGLLQQIGYAGALLARELPDGRLKLLDGHLRRDTTPDMKVPVLVLDVTEEEGDAILLTFDPVSAMAQADKTQLEALLATVRTEDKAIAAMLERVAGESAWQVAEQKEILDPEPQIDKAVELQKKWGTELGQLWQIGPHRLVCGDCRDEGTVGRLWADGGPKLRMVWTDPPYGIAYESTGRRITRESRGDPSPNRPIGNDGSERAAAACFTKAIALALRFAEVGVCFYAAVPMGAALPFFIAAFNEGGLSFKHSLVWVKQQMVFGRADYHYRHELILYGWIENGAHYFTDDRTQDSVFEVDRPHSSEFHPTTKPVELIARMVKNSSREGELVYDPFCGSGTTLLAAHQLGRIGYGVEIDPGYVAVTLERMTQLGLKPELVK